MEYKRVTQLIDEFPHYNKPIGIRFEAINDTGGTYYINFDILKLKTIRPFIYVNGFVNMWKGINDFVNNILKDSDIHYLSYVEISELKNKYAKLFKKMHELENNLSVAERLYLEIG